MHNTSHNFTLYLIIASLIIVGLLIIFNLPVDKLLLDEKHALDSLKNFNAAHGSAKIIKISRPFLYVCLNVFDKVSRHDMTMLRSYFFGLTILSVIFWLILTSSLKVNKLDSFLMYIALPNLLTISFIVMSEPIALFLLFGFLISLFGFMKNGDIPHILISTLLLACLLLTRQNTFAFVVPALIFLYFTKTFEFRKNLLFIYTASFIPLFYCFFIWKGMASPVMQKVFPLGLYPGTVIVSLVYLGIFFAPLISQVCYFKYNVFVLLSGILLYLCFAPIFDIRYPGVISNIFALFHISYFLQKIICLPFFLCGFLILARAALAFGKVDPAIYLLNLMSISSVLSWLIVGTVFFTRYSIFDTVFLIPYILTVITVRPWHRIWFASLAVINALYIYSFL